MLNSDDESSNGATTNNVNNPEAMDDSHSSLKLAPQASNNKPGKREDSKTP